MNVVALKIGRIDVSGLPNIGPSLKFIYFTVTKYRIIHFFTYNPTSYRIAYKWNKKASFRIRKMKIKVYFFKIRK